MKKKRNKYPDPGCQKALAFLYRAFAENQFKVGARLPCITALGAKAGVAHVTMWKAVAVLKRAGIIAGSRGKPLMCVRLPEEPDPAAGNLPLMDLQSLVPLTRFHRIKRAIEEDIINGRHAAGPLPSLKELSLTYNTSFRTIKKALAVLEDEGIINAHTVPLITARHAFSTIVLLWSGDREGRMLLGPFGEEILRRIESEFAKANVRLESFVYNDIGGRLECRDPITGKPKPIPFSSSILGYMVVVIGPEISGGKQVLTSLLKHQKPIGVLDLIGGWTIADSKNAPPVLMCSTAESTHSGLQIARFLISGGHSHIAFVSPFHKPQWSKNRLASLTRAFVSSGKGRTLAVATIDKFYSDYFAYESTWSMDLILKQFRAWRDSTGIASPRLADMPMEFVLWHAMLFCEIQVRLKKQLEELIKNPAITAWVCANDTTSLLAYDFLSTHKKKVPGDIALIGYDNSLEALKNNLSSYDFNLFSSIYALTRHIIAPAHTHRRGLKILEVEGTIIERATTGPR